MLHLMYCSCMAKTLYDAFKHAALMAPCSSLVFACRRREREDLGEPHLRASTRRRTGTSGYKILTKLDIKQPPGDMVTSEESAIKVANTLGYPVMVRPSFVLGGRAMEIVYG